MLRTIPLFEATKSLIIRYKFEYENIENAECVLPANKIHAQLVTAYQEFSDRISTDHPKNNSINKYNFSTAMVTFLYTDTSTAEGYLSEEVLSMTYALTSLNTKRIVSSIDYYEAENIFQAENVTHSKSRRDAGFNETLERRIKSFSEYGPGSYHVLQDTVDDVEKFETKIDDPMFHETFHHSEQAEMHMLSSRQGIRVITKSLEAIGADYIYGMVLDIYTNRLLCQNCNVGLLGMQYSYESGFLADLKQSLNKSNIETRKNNILMLSTRVSADKANKGANITDLFQLVNDKDVVHNYDPNNDCKVFQTRTSDLSLKAIAAEEKYSLSTYPGSIFSSSQLKLGKLQVKLATKNDATLPKLKL